MQGPKTHFSIEIYFFKVFTKMNRYIHIQHCIFILFNLFLHQRINILNNNSISLLSRFLIET